MEDGASRFGNIEPRGIAGIHDVEEKVLRIKMTLEGRAPRSNAGRARPMFLLRTGRKTKSRENSLLSRCVTHVSQLSRRFTLRTVLILSHNRSAESPEAHSLPNQRADFFAQSLWCILCCGMALAISTGCRRRQIGVQLACAGEA